MQLAPKTHDVLVALLRRARRPSHEAELLAEVWPEAFVEEGILAVHISALRRALNGRGEIRCIETRIS
jgi:DNA-binding winged helix-turn-helix (wHTH) protein